MVPLEKIGVFLKYIVSNYDMDEVDITIQY